LSLLAGEARIRMRPLQKGGSDSKKRNAWKGAGDNLVWGDRERRFFFLAEEKDLRGERIAGRVWGRTLWWAAWLPRKFLRGRRRRSQIYF